MSGWRVGKGFCLKCQHEQVSVYPQQVINNDVRLECGRCGEKEIEILMEVKK